MIRFGVCTSVDQATDLVDTGVDFIEENIQRLLMPLAPQREFAPMLAACRAAPLPVLAANAFFPPHLKLVGPQVDLATLLAYADTACGRASEIGIGHLVLGSGGARHIPDGWAIADAQAQFVELCHGIGPLASKHGVTVVIEALNRGECNFINSLAEAATLIDACAHPHIQLLTDIYHMLREDEPADQITAQSRLIRHAHIAEKAERTVPGVAGDDFTPYFAALKAMSYSGLMAIEARYGADLVADVRLGVATLRTQWHRA
jgi:sugar phosphate isomerase/epimerase